jgi:hypothetical protein
VSLRPAQQAYQSGTCGWCSGAATLLRLRLRLLPLLLLLLLWVALRQGYEQGVQALAVSW